MIVYHRWLYDTDSPAWRVGFDELCSDVRALITAAETRGVRVSGLSVGAPPLTGPAMIALRHPDRPDVEPLVLHRYDPAPFVAGSVEDPDSGLVADVDGPGLGWVAATGDVFDDLVQGVLLRAISRMGSAFQVASDADWDAWRGGRDLVAAVFADTPACPFATDVTAVPAGAALT